MICCSPFLQPLLFFWVISFSPRPVSPSLSAGMPSMKLGIPCIPLPLPMQWLPIPSSVLTPQNCVFCLLQLCWHFYQNLAWHRQLKDSHSPGAPGQQNHHVQSEICVRYLLWDFCPNPPGAASLLLHPYNIMVDSSWFPAFLFCFLPDLIFILMWSWRPLYDSPVPISIGPGITFHPLRMLWIVRSSFSPQAASLLLSKSRMLVVWCW